jgi:hypothetical protein
MWCAKCREDVVPAVPLEDDLQAMQCLRCGSLLMAAPEPISPPAGREGFSALHSGEVIDRVEVHSPIEPPPVIADSADWEIGLPVESSRGKPPRGQRAAREPRPETPDIQTQVARHRTTPPPGNSRLCWLLLGLGVAAFSCGALLIARSLLSDRDELWDLGTPLVLAGQAIFLIGLVLQLDVLWQQGKDTSQGLRDLDKRLSDSQPPQRTTPSNSVEPTFSRIHSAPEGISSPHLALQDLKGRLDAFGTRLSSH